MKKTIVVLLSAIVMLGVSSCQKTKDKINALTEFDMPYTTTFSVPATSITITVPVSFTTNVPTNASTTFASQKTVADKITEIKLTKLNLATDKGNFNYLKTITMFIQAPGQPEVQIATKTNIPDGLTSLDMDVSDTNIKSYITGDSFTLRISVTADGTIAQDQTVTVNEIMHAKGSLIN